MMNLPRLLKCGQINAKLIHFNIIQILLCSHLVSILWVKTLVSLLISMNVWLKQFDVGMMRFSTILMAQLVGQILAALCAVITLRWATLRSCSHLLGDKYPGRFSWCICKSVLCLQLAADTMSWYYSFLRLYGQNLNILGVESAQTATFVVVLHYFLYAIMDLRMLTLWRSIYTYGIILC